MKTLTRLFTAFILAIFLLPCTFGAKGANGTIVHYDAQDFFRLYGVSSAPLTNSFTLSPLLGSAVTIYGSTLIWGPQVVYTPDGVTNLFILYPNDYRMILNGSSVGIVLSVPDNTITNELTALINQGNGVGTYTYTNNANFQILLDSADVQAGLLLSKVFFGTGITVVTNGVGGNETITLSATGSSGSATNFTGVLSFSNLPPTVAMLQSNQVFTGNDGFSNTVGLTNGFNIGGFSITLVTNALYLQGFGTTAANGIFYQITSTVWTNNDTQAYIQFIAGVFNAINSAGQTMYTSATLINSAWTVGPFGSNPAGSSTLPATDAGAHFIGGVVLSTNGLFINTRISSPYITGGAISNSTFYQALVKDWLGIGGSGWNLQSNGFSSALQIQYSPNGMQWYFGTNGIFQTYAGFSDASGNATSNTFGGITWLTNPNNIIFGNAAGAWSPTTSAVSPTNLVNGTQASNISSLAILNYSNNPSATFAGLAGGLTNGNTTTAFSSMSSSILTPTNAILFCISNNITDPAMERKLIGFQDTFLGSAYSNQFIDAVLLSTRWNPTSRLTFMNYHYNSGAGRQFTLDGLVTNGGAINPIQIALPNPLTNGSMFIVYGYTNPLVYNGLQAIAGFSAGTSGSNAWWLLRSPQNQTFVAAYSNGVATDPANGMVYPQTSPASYNFDGDYYATYYNVNEAWSWNTNGMIDDWREGQQSYLNFYSLQRTPIVPGSYSNMDTVLIGKDPIGTYVNSGFNIKLVIILNGPMSTGLYNTCVRAAQWLEDNQEIDLTVGDSRICSSTDLSKGPNVLFNNIARLRGVSYYDMSYPGQAASAWWILSPGWTKVTNFFWPYLNHGNVTTRKLIWELGVNDINQSPGTSPTTAWESISNLNVACQIPGVQEYIMTPWAESTNSYVTNVVVAWTATGLQNLQSNITALDRIILTNGWRFSGGIIDTANFFSQSDMATNSTPQLTIDGVHMNGTNVYGNEKIAQIMAEYNTYPGGAIYVSNLYW